MATIATSVAGFTPQIAVSAFLGLISMAWLSTEPAQVPKKYKKLVVLRQQVYIN